MTRKKNKLTNKQIEQLQIYATKYERIKPYVKLKLNKNNILKGKITSLEKRKITTLFKDVAFMLEGFNEHKRYRPRSPKNLKLAQAKVLPRFNKDIHTIAIPVYDQDIKSQVFKSASIKDYPPFLFDNENFHGDHPPVFWQSGKYTDTATFSLQWSRILDGDETMEEYFKQIEAYAKKNKFDSFSFVMNGKHVGHVTYEINDLAAKLLDAIFAYERQKTNDKTNIEKVFITDIQFTKYKSNKAEDKILNTKARNTSERRYRGEAKFIKSIKLREARVKAKKSRKKVNR